MQLQLLFLCVAVCLTSGKAVAGKGHCKFRALLLTVRTRPSDIGHGYNTTSWVFQVPVSAPLVYFKATLPKSSNSGAPHPFGVGSTILFSNVEGNVGHGYNSTSGVFHAPVSGYYQFHALLQTVGSGGSDFSLMAQGSAKASIHLPKPWRSVSMSVIIHVNKGNHVFVKKAWENGNSPLRQGEWSQFSGFLLRKD